MSRSIVRCALLLSILGGCMNFDVSNRAGPAYNVNLGNYNTGQAVVTPRNDATYVNGEPMDARTRR